MLICSTFAHLNLNEVDPLCQIFNKFGFISVVLFDRCKHNKICVIQFTVLIGGKFGHRKLNESDTLC